MAVAGIFSMWSGFGSVVVSFFPAAEVGGGVDASTVIC